jgi:hypothetical protein
LAPARIALTRRSEVSFDMMASQLCPPVWRNCLMSSKMASGIVSRSTMIRVGVSPASSRSIRETAYALPLACVKPTAWPSRRWISSRFWVRT